jgi:hypothetical protein
MSAPKAPVDRDAIRAMVRQVLRDALPEAVRERVAAKAAERPPEPASAPAADSPAARTEEVSIASDAELAAFVRRVLSLGQDPAQREALQSGRLKFRLKRVRKSKEAAETARGGSERIDKGIVNERRVLAAAKAGKTLVLGRRVVVTPLARDKARQLGVQIERE